MLLAYFDWNQIDVLSIYAVVDNSLKEGQIRPHGNGDKGDAINYNPLGSARSVVP